MLLRMAVIGVGGMGKKYAQLLGDSKVRDATLSAVVSGNPDTRRWIKDTYGSKVVVCKEAGELFAASACFDAVLISTPHREHCRLAKMAFETGKHVLCEKPAGVVWSEAKAMEEVSRKAGKALSFVFQNRTLPVYRRMKQLLGDGELGALTRIHLHSSRYFRTEAYHQLGKWRSSWNGEGGGLLINQGQHILDIWQWLFGMPEALLAHIPFGKHNDFLVDDEATLLMKYPGDLTATFFITTGEAPCEERLEVVGTKGKVVIEGDTLKLWRHRQDTAEYRKTAQATAWDPELTEYTEETLVPEGDPYVAILGNFAAHIVKGEALLVPGKEGQNALSLCNAAYLSAWKGGEVSLPLAEGEYEEWLERKMKEEANG